ncbi:hypothetical protein LZG04_34200 [Saccharothrix sp. S26]|uniref:hypothetical protein n=1 Tax=Saccharothrix sp. S26 TaxID=2907215 RepID=UPI001F45CE9B|nr:hypothetical protein [Saccharothrix sp. S26]MCE6999829.1 hypothetical protein [Saccharothrix sp. S26]
MEAQLVAQFRRSQPHIAMTSFVTASGKRADLYYTTDSDVVVVEAKSLTTHGKVREAVAQLLDYAASTPEPATRLMALFPERPTRTASS